MRRAPHYDWLDPLNQRIIAAACMGKTAPTVARLLGLRPSDVKRRMTFFRKQGWFRKPLPKNRIPMVKGCPECGDPEVTRPKFAGWCRKCTVRRSQAARRAKKEAQCPA